MKKIKWKTLGEIIEYEQPTKYIVDSKKYNDNFSTPVLTAGQSFILGYTNETEGIYNASVKNPVIIFDDFTTSIQWIDFDFKVKSAAIKILKNKDSKINLRYCYHCMKIINFDASEHRRKWISQYSKIKIPIPPLKKQAEIAAVLDKFTELTEELTEELTAREAQYNYYRDMLLSEDYLNKILPKKNLIKKQLNEIAKLKRGKRLVRKELEKEGKYPVFQNSLTPLGYYNRKNNDGGKTCIISAGSAGEIFYQKKDFWAADDVFVIVSDSVLNKYLYYYLINKQNLIKTNIRKGTISRLPKEVLENLEILIPPIEIQNEIVNILDNFETLVNDIKQGLPREIELRQKQYEYYREKLLTFN